MAGFVFNAGANGLLAGTIVHASDTIKARLVLTSDSLDKDSTTMTGLGVTGNDVTLASKTGPTIDNTNDRNVYSCGNITFPSQPAGAEVDKIIIFKFVSNDAGSTPIATMDITAVTPNNGDILVTIPSTGSFYLQN